jgi:predicted lipase
VIFLGIRGTEYLYDHFINAKFRQRDVPEVGSGARFHRGFAAVVEEALPELTNRLRRMAKGDTPIYVTGHSLGGAIGAIFHALWKIEAADRIRTRACYTFGMPRYANAAALEQIRRPYHLFNTLDVVPTVPPRWAGYADLTDEIATNARNGSKRPVLRNVGTCIQSWYSRRGAFRYHKMESYVQYVRGMQDW